MSFGLMMRRVNWFGCPTCGREFRTQALAIGCRDAHESNFDASVHRIIGDGMAFGAKIEVFIEPRTGARYCGTCTARLKEEDANLLRAEIEDPGSCWLCKKEIVAPPPIEQSPKTLPLSERRELDRLDITPRRKKELFRQKLHTRLMKANATTLIGDVKERVEEAQALEERLIKEFGGYRDDPTRGDQRLSGVGHIALGPNSESVEVEIR